MVRMHPETKEDYIKRQKLSVIAIQNVLEEIKREQRVSMKHFKHIRDICDGQLKSYKKSA